MSSPLDHAAVRAYLLGLQDKLCTALEAADGEASFTTDEWKRPAAAPGASAGLGGGGRTRILTEGAVFEKAGIGFSEVSGPSLPPAATAHRPDLAGRAWEALGVSLVLHPRNPYVPTTHLNVRFFRAHPSAAGASSQSDQSAAAPAWWFGGGFDLTPIYGFAEDAVHWHKTAREAIAPFGAELHPRFKQWCDEYFFLRHRQEARGIGGVFFDDYNAPGFDSAYALMRAVGDAFLPAYLPIVSRRQAMPYGEHERRFQLYRRGRYAEFNLVQDRGTHFGLQSGGRAESILMSLPPLVRWDYGFVPEPGSPEAQLTEFFLPARDWLAGTENTAPAAKA